MSILATIIAAALIVTSIAFIYVLADDEAPRDIVNKDNAPTREWDVREIDTKA